MNGFSAASEWVLFPEQVFDGQAFRRLRKRVLAATAVDPLVVDLRNVRTCDLSALADLFGLLARLNGVARVRLRRGQEDALLEFLGLNRAKKSLRWRWKRDRKELSPPSR